MWTQYRKTFWRMQIIILVGSITIYFLFLDRKIIPTLAAFLVMQAGAVVGASWGVSLKSRFNPNRRQYDRLPLE